MDDSDTSHLWSRWIYLRILGLLYAVAFLSLSAEILGLVGPNGIFPAREYLSLIAHREVGPWGRFLAAPTLVWLDSGGWVLQGCCWAGFAAATLLIVNRLPRLALVVCWACYLSFLTVAPQFSWYASDSLLLEAAMLAIFAAPAGFRPGLGQSSRFSAGMLFLFGWLLFRLMLETGMSKILSGDPTWRSLETMEFFFETSPFPTWVGWFAHKLPHTLHRIMTAYVLFAEIGCSFLLFLGRRLRLFALAAWTVMQVGILLTGNFNTFNYHSIALAILLTDDDVLRRVLPLPAAPNAVADDKTSLKSWRTLATRAFLCMLFVVTVLATLEFFQFPRGAIPRPLSTILDHTRAFRSANHYVLYPIIPLERRVIVFEGSNDEGKTWRPYEFRFQTQRLDVRPRFIAPFSPRFDREAGRSVEMEPMLPYTDVPYVVHTARRLLEAEPSVVGLFVGNPFPTTHPDMIRTVLYRYRFTDLRTLVQTGNWWSRETLGSYSPVMMLDPVTREVRYVDPEEHP